MADSARTAPKAVADDFVDQKSLAGKAWWLVVAALRIGACAFVAAMFLALLITVTTRYQTDTILAREQGAGTELTAQQLLAQFGGIGASDASDPKKVAAASEIARLNRAALLASQHEQSQTQRVEAAGEALRRVAVRACGGASGAGDSAIEPLAAAARAQACLPQVGDAKAAALLKADLEDAQQAYQSAYDELRVVRAKRAEAQQKADAKRFDDGAELAKAWGALNAQNQMLSLPPAKVVGVAGFLKSIFSAPLLVSSAMLAFFAGMLGAVILQLVLMVAPGYLPLTFGSGEHFFLRVFMGGFIAVLILLAVQSGVSVAGLFSAAGLSGAAPDLSAATIADPTKLAFIGAGAGFFSEQIAQAVKAYAEQLLPKGASPPAAPDAPKS
jgi:hypothetical protein